MANTLVTPTQIAQEALFQLENNCVMGDKVHREYKEEFVKIGSSVTIRKPVKFVVSDGATRVNQDVIEETTSITIDARKHVSWKFSTQDLTLTIEEYSERYIKPAMIQLANKIDVDVATEGALKFHNLVGTPGNTPDAFSDLADAAQRMDNMAVPDDGSRCLVLNPAGRWGMANGLSGLFNMEMVNNTVRKGRLGEVANFAIYGDQNIYTHTVGDYDGTPLVNDASFTNDTNIIAFDGAGSDVAGWLKAGDIITIAGVYDINPVSRATLPYLKQFVVQSDVTTSSNAGNITVYPDLNDGSTTSTAAYQTVSALPANNAAITISGTAEASYPQNLAFHTNALALVTVPLELPDSVNFKARADWNGYSIRVVKDYDIDSDDEIIRLDILYGVDAIYPELGVRVTG